MARFDRDVHEMTPADEWVYEAIVEADAWGGHLPTADELDRELPLDRAELDAAIAHLTDAIGLVEAVDSGKGATRYRPVS